MNFDKEKCDEWEKIRLNSSPQKPIYKKKCKILLSRLKMSISSLIISFNIYFLNYAELLAIWSF